MAILRIPDGNRTFRDPREVTEYLASIGIEYARWEPAHPIEPGAAPEETLAAYAAEIEELKRRGGYVTADVIEVEAGDLIRVPRGTWHWFDLCADRRIRAIRLFQDPAGWTPHYTDSGIDSNYQPVCLGPSYFPSRSAHS